MFARAASSKRMVLPSCPESLDAGPCPDGSAARLGDGRRETGCFLQQLDDSGSRNTQYLGSITDTQKIHLWRVCEQCLMLLSGLHRNCRGLLA
ncbi:hypothetical protein BST47_29110 [Mycolicibacterium tusciae]|uniref:Uncharacterized protein n=1 Tax=Mycolicibacterium tusciae TaxID=75922 RepID=A0A1X0JDZ3_9MYCO|nr:hypothetical protein BST47_29110 [Mycolicibacterium tusciae]